ncbi:hypothetical protein [Verrucomicrobium spinosum]|nr:hypothetical protein [Verrucomicrobium spinosum]
MADAALAAASPVAPDGPALRGGLPVRLVAIILDALARLIPRRGYKD